MTKINKIVMHGFKSFAKRTELLFGNQFNVILGPNGSGKSNVGDAVCFVLGRGSSKALRVEKSANLIYNGGKLKTPAKLAEVSIFFDNEKKTFPFEEKEVKLSRIVKQNGASVYRINNKKHTRQEILDMLSHARIDPDGFNLILQGDIAHFIEMPPVERRKIIEEIAGISVYEDKKEKAVRELTAVEQKINDAELILSERKTHLNELRKERDQALKFKELRDKVNENKATYLKLQIDKKQEVHDTLQKKIDHGKEQFDDVEQNVKGLKTKNEEKRKEVEKITKEIEDKGEREQVLLHREVEQLKVALATNKTRISNCQQEIAKVKSRKEQLKANLTEVADRIKALEARKKEIGKLRQEKQKQLERLDVSLAQFNAKHGINDATAIEKEIGELDQQADVLEKQIQEIRTRQQDLLRRKDQIDYELKTIDARLDKVKQLEAENAGQIQALKMKRELFKKTTLELNTLLSEDSSLAAQMANARSRFSDANERLAKVQAKTISVQEKLAGDLAVKKILELRREKHGIHGMVSELGEVNSKYATALEVAAGNKITSIVVENDKVAADCIAYLKENRLGIATFLPLNKIKPIRIDDETKDCVKAKGTHGLALDLVSYDPKFKNVFSYVFGGSVVVDDIETARRIGVGRAKMVTLDGDLADISGAMKGGFRTKGKTGLGFQQKELMKELHELEKAVADSQQLMDALDRKRHENEERIVSLRKAKAEMEAEIITLEKSLHLESSDLETTKRGREGLLDEMKAVDKELEQVIGRISTVNRDLAAIKIKRQELRTRISQLHNPSLVAELKSFEEMRTAVREEMIKLDAEVTNADAQIALAVPEHEKTISILKQHDKEIEDFDHESKNLSEKVKQDEALLAERERQTQEFYQKYKELFAKRQAINDEIARNDRQADELRERQRKIEIEMNTHSLETAHIKGELAALLTEFEQYKGTTINDKTEGVLRQEIERYEKMVQNLGAVNMRALDVYEAIEKEYNALLEKKEKLKVEKGDVLALINEIETKKKDIFMKSFDVVNEHFKSIFLTLSTKGEAFLELENPETIFDEGVLIKVRLIGTKFLDIRSLSGGEKAMTALAFIFAIQDYQPHSFYIFDEVDAALDKHNSEKLAKLIRQYSDKAQYIVVSHNDAIISEGDYLYGVSMDEHNVSNVTSLKL
ncbi:chromosome segregation protein SMC [Candidatus Woesearchaeota archaeon]|nr:chromosome segregation protein SMC [Candidatus Woesearchaeota archaeon]